MFQALGWSGTGETRRHQAFQMPTFIHPYLRPGLWTGLIQIREQGSAGVKDGFDQVAGSFQGWPEFSSNHVIEFREGIRVSHGRQVVPLDRNRDGEIGETSTECRA